MGRWWILGANGVGGFDLEYRAVSGTCTDLETYGFI